MDKCPKCGNKLSSIDVLCPKCGALVEVVQVRKCAGPQGSAGACPPVRKTLQQNLIVDDWPADDSSGILSGAAAMPPKASEEPAQTENDAPFDSEFGTEETYLSLLKMMNLPELESIDEEQSHSVPGPPNIAEYAASELHEDDAPPFIKSTESVSSAPEAAVPHHWLEIEEIPENAPAYVVAAAPAYASVSEAPDAVVSASASEPDSPAAAAVPAFAPAYPAETGTMHRYRANRRKEEALRKKEAPGRSVGRVLLMILAWLLVCGALFGGFFFLDRYVTSRYGSYQTMLYEITNGTLGAAPSDSQTIPEETPFLEG